MGGQKAGKKPLEQVLAAPIGNQGLEGEFKRIATHPGGQGRRLTAATALAGALYLVGGVDSGGNVTASCRTLQVGAQHFEDGPALWQARCYHTVSPLGGAILVVGGCDRYPNPNPNNFLASCELLEAGSSAWVPAPALPEARAHHAACLWEGRMWVSGGYTGRRLTDSVVSWGLGDREWRQEASLCAPRR